MEATGQLDALHGASETNCDRCFPVDRVQRTIAQAMKWGEWRRGNGMKAFTLPAVAVIAALVYAR